MYNVEVHDKVKGCWRIAYYTIIDTYEDAVFERDKVVQAIRTNKAENRSDMVAISRVCGRTSKFVPESVVAV